MKLTSLFQAIAKIEPWVAGFYLIYFIGFELPPPLASLMNLASYGILAILVACYWRQVIYGLTKLDISLILLNVMTVASVFWSVAPDFTSIESRTIVRATIFGIYLAVRYGLRGEMQILYWSLGIGAILSLLAGAAVPSYGIHTTGEFVGSWKGVFGFKNLFASVMTMAAILFLIAALNDRRQRWLAWGLLMISILLIILSKGRTALACLFISLYLFPLYNFVKKQFKLRVILISTAILFTLSLAVLVLGNLEFIVIDVLGKNLEFNGRLPIWTLMMEKVLERPWLGYGYAAFWTSDASYYLLTRSWALDAFQAGIRFNAHNGYLDLLLQLGFVGLGLYFVSLATVLARITYLLIKTKAVELFWALQTIIFLSLINLSDSLSIGSGGGQWSLYVSFSVVAAIQCEQIRKNHRLKVDSTSNEVQFSS